MRFRDTEQEQARTRAEVRKWCGQHPTGTVEEMLAELGPHFHKDYVPLMRVAFFRAQDQRKCEGAGTAQRSDGADR